MDYIASAENIAAKLCNKYRRIDRLLADMAAIEAAEIYLPVGERQQLITAELTLEHRQGNVII